MFNALKMKVDALRNIMRSEQGVARYASRQIRSEIGLHEREETLFNKYMRGAKLARVDTAASMFKGDLVILETDMNKIHTAFREILVFDERIVKDLRDLIRETDRVPYIKADRKDQEQFNSMINAAIKCIESLMNQSIASIAGIESGSLSMIKRLEIESQEREIAQEFFQVSNDAKIWKKNLRNAYKAVDGYKAGVSIEQRKAEHQATRGVATRGTSDNRPLGGTSSDPRVAEDKKALFDELNHVKLDMLSSLQTMAKDIALATANLTNLLSEIHHEFLEIMHSELYKGKVYQDIDEKGGIEQPLSLDILLMKRKDGGFSFPEDGSGFGHDLYTLAVRIEAEHNKSLKEDLGKMRIILSDAQHLVQ